MIEVIYELWSVNGYVERLHDVDSSIAFKDACAYLFGHDAHLQELELVFNKRVYRVLIDAFAGEKGQAINRSISKLWLRSDKQHHHDRKIHGDAVVRREI
jgi:hypothetical protein